MKKNSVYLLIFPLMLAMMACNNQGLKKTKSGILYKIISDGKGETVKRGQFLKINFVQKVRDSILFNTADAMPVYIRVDSVGPIYSPAEIFALLRKGDSAIVVQTGDSLQRKFGQNLPPYIKKKDKIILSLKVIDLFTDDSLVKKDKDEAMVIEKAKEIKVMEDYIAKNKINVQKTEKGTYVEVVSPGDGPSVDSGKQVAVRYTGKLFPSGKVFESNMTPPANEPIKFVIGRRSVIPGWDDGLKAFKKGGKGTLYIPAFMAYDAQQGPGGKPYENLIFDIEIVDVTDAPVQASRPMPNIIQNAKPKK
ncbi:MAG: FKBP-type peptidyl-prolyl cis-trans isomerase [Bacteroidetes bacterium]|nr:FKBP-type peptidyl-prolyl cis-trans isomerase [Bacteroidota bacterium]